MWFAALVIAGRINPIRFYAAPPERKTDCIMSTPDFPNPDNDNPDEFATDEDIAAEIAAAEGRDFDGAPPKGDKSAASGADTEVEDELASVKDQVLRLAAELENTRRRAARDKTDAARYAIATFARDLLSVADNFERALSAAPEAGGEASPDAVGNLITGLRMTDKELHTVLERHGVKRIDPKGEKFDPNLHQAVAQMPSDAPAGHVAEVAQTGFMIGDRVLRAAMVVVSTGGGPAAEQNGASDPGANVDTQA